MKRWSLIAAAAMSAAFSVFGVAAASAATEFGDNCVGNTLTETTPVTVFDISVPGNTLPIAAPSGGVITKWKVNLVPAPVTFPQTLKVLHPNGPNTVQIVGEATGNITGGSNSFDTRVPVQAGDLVGLFGSNAVIGSEEVGNLVCEVSEKTVYGGFLGSGGGVGSTTPFITVPESEVRIPVFAVLEPDADNDGYGDETQDKCPTSAATHDACPAPTVVPPVTLSTSATSKKGSAKILVTSSTQASVTVVGTVRLGKGKTAKLNGGTQLVSPGTLAKFTLLFPKALKEKLKALSPKRSLTLTVTTTAPNSAGALTTNELKVKLKGQAKPVSRKGKGKRG